MASVNSNDSPAAPRRVVLLGASNLTRGISTVYQTARLLWPEPLEIFLAFGHGRSYGMPSRVLGRELPGIAQCGLWQDFKASLAARRDAPPTVALLTDIGNDLIYGSSVAVVADWVEQCLDRLAEAEAQVIVTGLPVTGLKDRPRWQFELLRRLLFPTRQLEFAEVIDRALQLDERLSQLAAARGLCRVEPRADWYGWDPIHIRFKHWPHAWQEILAPWNGASSLASPATASLRRWVYLRSLRPLERRFWGWEQHRTQPAGKFFDGTTIAIY